jgi:hypothetical protein
LSLEVTATADSNFKLRFIPKMSMSPVGRTSIKYGAEKKRRGKRWCLSSETKKKTTHLKILNPRKLRHC